MKYEPVGQGIRARVAEFGGMRMTESLHLPDSRLGWHAHEQGCLTLLLDGGTLESFRSEEVACRRGGVLIKPPAVRHSSRFGPRGAHCLIVELIDEERDRPGSFSSLFDRVTYRSLDGGVARQIVAELAARDTASEIILEGIVIQLVGVAMRSHASLGSARTREAPWLSAVQNHIRSHFRSKLSIAGLAASVGVHPDHLSRVFRRHHGHSIGDMIRELRLSWAAEELIGSDREISDIGIGAGFCDQSHFTRAFRRRFGMPPGMFRATH